VTEIKPAVARWGATGAIIAAITISLAAVDQVLVRTESAETRNSAQHAYLKGSQLLKQGKAAEAADALRNAHNMEPENSDYELQLIAALTSSGDTAAAEPFLTEILQREPNDGRANLIAARLMTRKGDEADAEAYYHRAIYGEWPRDASAHRVAVRMELIDLLARRNRKQELLAELISVEAEAPATREVQNRLGELFLVAGAPARAASVYERLVQKDPRDIQAYERLGDAELEQGQYRSAHEAFLRAFMREPNNGSVRAQLQMLNTVTGLDPTLRQLTSAEKYRRSVRILQMAREALGQCAATHPAAADANLLKMADAVTGGKMPSHVTNELAEEVLALAEKLWHAGGAACGERPLDQNALDLIMKKLNS
jgi:tetratricopeptide (TPR) repeat protein